METPRLIAGSLVLRAPSERDAPAIARASSDPYIQLLSGRDHTDLDGAREHVRRQKLRTELGLGLSLAIADSGTDEALGGIGLWLRAIAPDGTTCYRGAAHGRASLDYWVSPEFRRRGYATAALDALSAWALRLSDVHRLELFIEPANEPSWRTAERARYHREGLLRSWQQLGDSRRDMYVYARLPND
jgi:RimJ/RimL family protein N-acetyltransferase